LARQAQQFLALNAGWQRLRTITHVGRPLGEAIFERRGRFYSLHLEKMGRQLQELQHQIELWGARRSAAVQGIARALTY
jgi:hypothetical protein